MSEPAKVILFSGGRTSGYMLWRLIQERITDWKEWIVVFCNTGKERSETLDFVHEVETRWDVPITWLEYHRVPARDIKPGVFPTEKRNQNLAKAAELGETTHWFREVNYKTASRNGEPFDELLEWASVLPNVVSRICSTQLKLRSAMRYLFSIGVQEYCPIIGIRKDEEHRSIQILASCESFEHPLFPLCEWNSSERDIMDFWKSQPFDLRLKQYEGNCDLCFLKAKWKRLLLVKENPGMADWWINWESKKNTIQMNDGKYFRLGETYAELVNQVERDKDQSEFCFIGNMDKDIPCSCAEKAFGGDEE